MDSVPSISEARKLAARVAKWLADSGRPDEAVAVLCAWAARGGNDPEGQTLLAEALRLDPAAKLAQMAFEQMEGITGQHQALAEATERYSPAALEKVEAEMRRPTFRRAQIGFNNNIKFSGQVFHVQTEDSGLDQPHIVTHLFADGGRIIKSHKRSYVEHITRSDVAEFVRGLMKHQHLEMVLMLREGRFAEVLAGRAIGGIEVLTEPPNVENIKKLGKKDDKKTASVAPAAPKSESVPAPAAALAAPVTPAAAAIAAPVPATAAATVPAAPAAAPSVSAAVPPPKQQPKSYFSLIVLRSLAGGPESYTPAGTRATIGAEGEIALAGERFCHPREAELAYRDGRLFLKDLEGGNGVFLRIRTSVELDFSDEFVVGDQLLRIERNPDPDDGPDPAPTYFYSSPKWPSSFRATQIFEGGALGCCVVARGNTLQIGSAIGDLIFPEDPLVSEQHCLIEEQAGSVVLTDLGSRTGVFVRVRHEQEIGQNDEVMVGRTRLVVRLLA